MAARQKDSKVRYAPIDLSRVPQLDELLERIGVGRFDTESLSSPVGRNNTWAGRTVDGHRVFVKQLVGNAPDVRERMSRILAFESFSAQRPGIGLLSPRLLGTDADAQLVAFELIEGVRSGSELMVDEEFTTELAAETGRRIGLLHAAEIPVGVDLDRSPAQFPPVELLHGIPLETLENSSAATLETWRILQGDTELIEAVRRLRGWEAEVPGVPSHCDFRVDQLLIAKSDLYITDWEEFRIADAARDVGAFAGEWLYRSVLDIVTTRGDADFAEFELSHELVLKRGAEKLARLLPLVEAFWAAYRAARPDIEGGMAVRATAFAGWHLLDRLLAGSSYSARLSGISRAAAGVGRGALLAPNKFAAAIGFA